MLVVKMTDVKLTDQITGHENAGHEIAGHTRKLSYHKDDRAMRPIYGCPENFSGIPDYAHGYSSRDL